MDKSKYFYSNCLLESLKAWIKSPKNISIYKRGSLKLIYRKKMFPHYYWKDKRTGKCFDFSRDTTPKGLSEQILFKGYIREIKYLMMFGY